MSTVQAFQRLQQLTRATGLRRATTTRLLRRRGKRIQNQERISTMGMSMMMSYLKCRERTLIWWLSSATWTYQVANQQCRYSSQFSNSHHQETTFSTLTSLQLHKPSQCSSNSNNLLFNNILNSNSSSNSTLSTTSSKLSTINSFRQLSSSSLRNNNSNSRSPQHMTHSSTSTNLWSIRKVRIQQTTRTR